MVRVDHEKASARGFKNEFKNFQKSIANQTTGQKKTIYKYFADRQPIRFGRSKW